MSRQGDTAVYATVSQRDRVRIDRFRGDQSFNQLLRSLMSDALEDAGEAPLEPMVVTGIGSGNYLHRRIQRAAEHGTLARYGGKHQCRCDRCREAMRNYQRWYRAQGGTNAL